MVESIVNTIFKGHRVMEHSSTHLDTQSLKTLSQRTSAPWLKDALLDWGVITLALSATTWWPHPLSFMAAILIVGNRQHALAILGHDGTHYTLSHHRAWNDALTGALAFWPLLLTVNGYRNLHFSHHKHVGTAQDPELAHKRSRSPQWDLPTRLSKIVRYALLDLVGYSVADYLIIIRFSKPNSRMAYLPMLLWHLLFIGSSLAMGWWQLPLVWYLALPTSFMMFFRLRLWLEHQGTGETHRLSFTAWQGALLAPHYGWMHWEHHHWPTIPYHRLPQARHLTPGIPCLTLGDLVNFFKTAPNIASGMPLKESQAEFHKRDKAGQKLAA